MLRPGIATEVFGPKPKAASPIYSHAGKSSENGAADSGANPSLTSFQEGQGPAAKPFLPPTRQQPGPVPSGRGLAPFGPGARDGRPEPGPLRFLTNCCRNPEVQISGFSDSFEKDCELADLRENRPRNLGACWSVGTLEIRALFVAETPFETIVDDEVEKRGAATL